MNLYYIWEDLLTDSRKEAVLGDAPEQLDDYELIDGQKLNIDIVGDLIMHRDKSVVGKRYTDNLLTYAEWALIASSRLREMLSDNGVDNIDWYPVTIIDDETGTTNKDFSIGNIIGLLDCIDHEKTVLNEDDELLDLQLDTTKIKNSKIFRIYGHETHIVVDESIKIAVEEGKFTGIKLSPANGYMDFGAEPLEDD